MFKKQIAAAAAAAAVAVAMPAAASDLNQSAAGMMFFISVPLDAKTPKQQMPALGLSFQGERAYQRVTIDTRMFETADRLGFALGGIEAKWVVAGVVAAGAVVAVASKDKSTTNSQQQQQQQQQQQLQQQQQQQQQNGGGGGGTPCPVTPRCP